MLLHRPASLLGRGDHLRRGREGQRAAIEDGAAARRSRRRRPVAAALAAADDAPSCPPASTAPTTPRRSALLLLTGATASALTAAASRPPAARAALLLLDDDAAAERAYELASPAVVGLAAERRPGELAPLGSGTVWAVLPAEDEGGREEAGTAGAGEADPAAGAAAAAASVPPVPPRYKDLFIVATYRQVAGAARSDAREGGGLPSLRVFVAAAGDSDGSGAAAGTAAAAAADAAADAADAVGPYAAVVLGLDATRDLAVLRARVPAACPAAALPLAAAARAPRKGQAVFLLGRSGGGAGGAGLSLASGVVSALGRSAPAPSGARLYGALQTDVKVGAANVGGPLVDSAGNLLGVAVCPTFSAGGGRDGAPAVQPSASAGVSFALPASVLLEAVPNLAAYGNASGRV